MKKDLYGLQKLPVISPISNGTQARRDIDNIMDEFEDRSTDLYEKERIVKA
jgi:hypothetical protein